MFAYCNITCKVNVYSLKMIIAPPSLKCGKMNKKYTRRRVLGE